MSQPPESESHGEGTPPAAVPRRISHRYLDPLDVIWIETARAIGLKIRRSEQVYASTDGRGTLEIAAPGAFDADDCLAQMIFHELCHSLVQGPDSFRVADWGLDNETARDDVLEHACMRVQAALLEPLGLRRVLGPTTDFRAYYDELGDDPLTPRGNDTDDATVLAGAAYQRAKKRPWAPHLERALEATADIVHAVSRVTEGGHATRSPTGSEGELPGLFALTASRAAPHPAGFVVHPSARRSDFEARCGACSWSFCGGPGRPVLRCRQAEGARIEEAWPACDRYEDDVDCLSCGACCREAYDVVALSARDPAAAKHSHLMVIQDGQAEMKRVAGRCIALQGGSDVMPRPACAAPDQPPLHRPGGAPYTCAIYEERPKPCRDFELTGEHCLSARRRVGLSR